MFVIKLWKYYSIPIWIFLLNKIGVETPTTAVQWPFFILTHYNKSI